MDAANINLTAAGIQCPGCGLPLEDWPQSERTQAGDYCCSDCAQGVKCSCSDKHLGAVSA
jgi:hypothetical protein